MKTQCLRILVASAFISQVHAENRSFGSDLEKIGELEAARKWKDALPIYDYWFKKRQSSVDGLTLEFVCRKGICELQGDAFTAAVKSFDWVIEGARMPEDAEVKLRAMLYLAESLVGGGEHVLAE